MPFLGCMLSGEVRPDWTQERNGAEGSKGSTQRFLTTPALGFPPGCCGPSFFWGCKAWQMHPEVLRAAESSVVRMARVILARLAQEKLACGLRPAHEDLGRETRHDQHGVCGGRSRETSGPIRRFRIWASDLLAVRRFGGPMSPPLPTAGRTLGPR